VCPYITPRPAPLRAGVPTLASAR